jgi:glycosyltransferase involved in cell wall biosynthesis
MPEQGDLRGSPSVWVGIPTYNRAATLPRAIESVLLQTHSELELVISDNASSDATREICERYANADVRVRYLRQPVNRGPTANFNTLFQECRGDYVLMLSDDDWLDLDYVERCLSELAHTNGHTLVCGLARLYEDGEHVIDGVEMQLAQTTGPARILAYFSKVRDNSTFYGVISREALQRAAPLLNVLANDWLLVAAIAYQGTVCTLPSTGVNRSLGGTSKDTATTAAMFGKPTLQARLPHLVMAWHTFAQLGWRACPYDDLPAWRRLVLGARCALLVIDWTSLAWHMTAPPMAALGHRPRGRPPARAYFALTRRLGAGRQKYF